MHGPSPDDPHPMKGFPQAGFPRPPVKNPLIEVSEYNYDGPHERPSLLIGGAGPVYDPADPLVLRPALS